MTTCIVCGRTEVEQFLDLGRTALANKFLTADELAVEESAYPLRVGFCLACSHVQLMEHVEPSEMFEDYLYMSSMSETLKAHFNELAATLTGRLDLGADDMVVDIGCNDGTLLRAFDRRGVRTLGVDPAENLARLPEARGIERVVTFFDSTTADRIVDGWGRAALVTATNTFPHIPELHGFIDGVGKVLRPGGTFVIEAHYVADLLEQCAFDTIYHEHVSYWALGPMKRLFADHGMEVVDVERLPLHHGQLRVFVQRVREGEIQESVAQLADAERQSGLDELETYRRFAHAAYRIRDDLKRTLRGLRSEGKQVVGYGAPAKASTLLGFLELGPEVIPYICDRSPLKQGRFTPGTHIPIVGPERLIDDQPEYVLLLAWNFAEEIMAQLSEYRRRGGRFILPVPEINIV